MGTNFYIRQRKEGEEETDEKEYPELGENSLVFLHIGKQTGHNFIYYISRDYQINRLNTLNKEEELVVDEYGNKMNVPTFLEKIDGLYFTEQDCVFF